MASKFKSLSLHDQTALPSSVVTGCVHNCRQPSWRFLELSDLVGKWKWMATSIFTIVTAHVCKQNRSELNV